jgi:hypothetical protein
LESLKGRENSEDMTVDERIILKWILGNSAWGVGWINIAQDTYLWRVLVKTVKKLRNP